MTDPELARRAAALAARPAARSKPRAVPSVPAVGADAATAPLALVTAPRTAPGGRRRRPHPAAASRILAAGLSASAMFGLVTVLTLSAGPPTATAFTGQSVAAVATPPKRVVVIIHRRHPASTAPAPTVGSDATAAPARAATRPASASSHRPAPVTTTAPS